MNCPECNELMERQDDEPDVNIQGGYMCPDCGDFISDIDLLEYDNRL